MPALDRVKAEGGRLVPDGARRRASDPPHAYRVEAAPV